MSFSDAEEIVIMAGVNGAKLDLSGLGIDRLPPRILNLTNLSELDLSGNKFEDMPPVIFTFDKLTSLKMRSNRVGTIPKEIEKLKKLEKLDLSRNRIDELPDEIGRLESLKGFNVASNKLKVLPPAIACIGRKPEAGPSETGLPTEANPEPANANKVEQTASGKSVPAERNELGPNPDDQPELVERTKRKLLDSALEEFDLSDNELTDLPDGLYQFAKLRLLNLSNNKLKGLKKDLKNLKALEVLDLGGNSDEFKLPPSITDMKSLARLYLKSARGGIAKDGDLSTYRVGAKEASSGHKITAIHVSGDDIVAYSTEEAIIRVYGPDFHLDKIPEFVLHLGRIRHLINLLHPDPRDRMREWRDIVPQVSLGFLMAHRGEKETANSVLASVEKKLTAKPTFIGRKKYIAGAFCVMIASLVLSTAFFFLFHGSNLDHEYDTLRQFFYALTAASFGGYLSIHLNIERVEINPVAYEAKWAYFGPGASRILISMLAGIFVFFMLKAGLGVRGLEINPDKTSWWPMLVIAMVAGFSETLVPNLIRNIERSPES